jgi:glutathione S-transferase
MKAYIHPASPNCIAVLAAAHEAGIELATEFVDLFAGKNLEHDFIALNPNGLVPVLVDGDYVLWETTAILQYLAALDGGQTLLPKEERARADVTRWQSWGIAHWQPALQTLIFERLFKRLRGLGAPDAKALEEAMPRLAKHASILESTLASRHWLGGDQITVADLAVGSYLVYAAPAAIPLDEYPHLLAWWCRLRTRSSWSAAEARMPRLD